MLKVYSNLRVYLESLSIDDADSIAMNADDREIAYNLGILTFPHPYKREDALRFIEKATQDFIEGKQAHFGIHINEGLIGVEGYNSLDLINRNGEIGYWIGRGQWRKGYGKEAVRLLVGFGFEVLKLHRIQAKVFTFNKASSSLLESLGFKKEGTMRGGSSDGKKYLDSDLFSLLEDEYKDNIEVHYEGLIPFLSNKDLGSGAP